MNRFGSNSFENENEQYPDNIRIGKQLADNNPRPWNESPHHSSHDMRHGHRPNYRPDTPNNYDYEARRQETSSFRQNNSENPYYRHDTGAQHHDTGIWTERNAYKDSDYRYRSGHRGYWHEDYDEKYEGRQHNRHPEGFFQHMGEGIREGWNNLFNRNQPDQGEERHHQERHFNRHQERRWPANRWDQNENQSYNQQHRNLGAEWHNPNRPDEDYRY